MGTLMQDLLDIGFFVISQDANYLDDSLDISYAVDEDAYSSLDLNGTARSFAYNSGTYTVHKVHGTNLYLIYVDDWSLTTVYPSDCPGDDECSSVISPGCIEDDDGECESIVTDVCNDPDTPTLA